MNTFRLLLALFAAAGLAIAGVASARILNTGRASACTTNEGTVEAYETNVSHSCSTTETVGQQLFASETVRTSTGQFTFGTAHFNRCIEWRDTNGSADVLLPRAGVAIKHLYGKIWCRHLATDHYRHVIAPGVQITANGTIFGIDSNAKGSLVKVAQGSVTALSKAGGKSLTVPKGFQAFVPTKGPLQALQPFIPDEQDTQAVALLSLDVNPIGLPQVREFLKSRAELAAVIVGEDATSIQAQMNVLTGFKVAQLFAKQAQSNPKVVLTGAMGIGAKTVVVTGSFQRMQAVLKAVTRVLPPQYSVLFVETPPKTTISDGPTDPSNTTNATFAFASDEPDATFRCAIDTSEFTPCQSPQMYSSLGETRHRFSIYAVDRSGKPGPITAYDWTIALPDLVISNLSVNSVTVANIGAGNAGGFSLRVHVGSGADYPFSVSDGLAAGAQATLSFDPYYGPINASADVNNDVEESNETNNSATADFTIG